MLSFVREDRDLHTYILLLQPGAEFMHTYMYVRTYVLLPILTAAIPLALFSYQSKMPPQILQNALLQVLGLLKMFVPVSLSVMGVVLL